MIHGFDHHELFFTMDLFIIDLNNVLGRLLIKKIYWGRIIVIHGFNHHELFFTMSLFIIDLNNVLGKKFIGMSWSSIHHELSFISV